MFDDASTIDPTPPRQPTQLLVCIGFAAVFLAAVLAARLIWEETVLTLQYGPQMIGFR